MAEKAPCRWVLPKSVQALWGWGDGCIHPVVAHLRGISQAHCHGCPCHEPEPAKDTQRTDPPKTGHDTP